MTSAIPVLLGKEHCESDHREEPCKRKHGRDAVEVALGSSRSESRAASAAEHVGQATAAATVQENSDDHGEHRSHIDDDGEDCDEVTHGGEL
jgi:hypothetical protein